MLPENRDVLPPPGWQPKSAFFKAIWAKAEFKLTHPRMTITCPHCGDELTFVLNYQEKP